ncbi:MAG: 2,3-bisphosphoglycerate-dependent phosphoglycerate mutase [Chitinophagaceae bacterium]|jgi:2,3-bisphosphoglycerate-dependent phosphoglycerate mutase|nr:2,3-bisphosphoglycerate-dependent phosphoglycerate mutase [Chitinophagaceae bacterium]
MPILVLVRHGESQWNKENRFTGTADVDITEQGIADAAKAGLKLKDINFAHAFVSEQKRAQQTLSVILKEIHQESLSTTVNRALNERDYGQLQGLNKAETAKQYGEEQVAIWRRSYTVIPPGGESLKEVHARVIPYYQQHISPLLRAGNNILIVAHGNSLRTLIMYLENSTSENIEHINLPGALPRMYTMNKELDIEEVKYL